MSSNPSNINDAGIAARAKFIDDLFTDKFGVAVVVTPIAYEEGFPFPYNNFVYVVDVDASKLAGDSLEKQAGNPFLAQKAGTNALDKQTGRTSLDKQAGTHPIPAGLSSFILRLPNLASGYNDEVRVENEVAALSLARDALQQKKLQDLVPRVFAWGSAKGGEQGWILQERMPGGPLLEDFPQINEHDQATILGQMADVLAAFQQFEIPSSVKSFGGLGFGPEGEYTSAPLSIYDGGPFSTYEGLVRTTIQSKLSKADKDPRIQGWRENNIRARLDKFLDDGLHQILKKMGSCRKVLVHADFSTDNILYDKETKKLTAVLDFDFSHIGSVADEYFRSLGHGIGRFPDLRGASDEELALRQAMLSQFPIPLPASNDEVQWTAAKLWDDMLRERDLQRPATIPNITELSDVFWLSSQILPFRLCNEVVVGNSTPEQLQRRTEEGQKSLSEFLHEHGF